MAESTCQECGGAGVIEDDGGDEVTCTSCNGTGVIEFYDPAVDGPDEG